MVAAYQGVKHFQFMVEGRDFCIYTDHLPLTHAFKQKLEKASPRQLRHIDFIGQFTTDIRHIAGIDNPVADFLSRIDAIQLDQPINYEEIAKAQEADEELPTLISSGNDSHAFIIKRFAIPESQSSIFCDASNDRIRPFIPRQFRGLILAKVHCLSHPGVRATNRLLRKRYFWPNMNKDCQKFVRECIPCQRSKVGRHNSAPISTYSRPSERFTHINIDLVGPMLPSQGYKYCLTMIDRFTRWPEAIPIMDITAKSVARGILFGSIARFGTPLAISTDQGGQFKSDLYRELSQLLGSSHFRTTSWHPPSNGIIERLHRTVKSSIMCHQTPHWIDALPFVMLGLRSTYKEDIKGTPAELTYGTTLRLPNDFFIENPNSITDNEFVKDLRRNMQQIRPTATSNHHNQKIFVHKDMSTCTHVFVRNDTVRPPLKQPFDGPYEVLQRGDKFFKISIKDKPKNISIDRLKPAFFTDDSFNPTSMVTPAPSLATPVDQPINPTMTTRSGRRVVIPERYGQSSK